MSNSGFEFAKKYGIPLSDALEELRVGTTLRAIEHKVEYNAFRQNMMNTLASKSSDQEKSKQKAIKDATRKEGGYTEWTVNELKAELKSRGLKQTGNKDDYVERLTDFDLNGPPVEKAKANAKTVANAKAKANVRTVAKASLEPPFEIHEFSDYTSTDHDLSNEVMLFLMAALFQDFSSTLITDADVENLNHDTPISRMLRKLVTRMRQIIWNDEDDVEGVDEIDNYIHGLPEVSSGKPYIYRSNDHEVVKFARLIYQRGYDMSLPRALKLNEDVHQIQHFIQETIRPIIAEPFSYKHCAAAKRHCDGDDDDDDIFNSQTSSQMNWAIKGPQDDAVDHDVFQQDDSMYVSSDSEEEYVEPVKISNDDIYDHADDDDDDNILNSLLSYEVVDADNLDAGNLDAGNLDAGNLDAGNLDAGNLDAGNVDAGNLDAGNLDAGNLDADNQDADNQDADNLGTGTDVDDELEVDNDRKRKRSDKIDDRQKKKRKREKRRREREERIVQTVIRTIRETMPSFGGMHPFGAMPSFGGMQMPFVLMQVPFGQQPGGN
jgi:hypothetical protein